MPKAELVDLTLKLHAETAKAVRVSDDGDDDGACWLPLSQIEINQRLPDGMIDVTMPAWLAKQKELI